jgi:hypothetical protein
MLFGNCHLSFGLTDTMTISGSDSLQRNATPPVETWFSVRIFNLLMFTKID